SFRYCNWLSDWSSIPNSSSRFCIDKKCVMNPVLIVGVLFISAFLSGIAVFFVRRDNANALKLILSFSGAYLFSITVLHLIPHVYHTHNDANETVGLFVLLGFLFQLLLEQFS